MHNSMLSGNRPVTPQAQQQPAPQILDPYGLPMRPSEMGHVAQELYSVDQELLLDDGEEETGQSIAPELLSQLPSSVRSHMTTNKEGLLKLRQQAAPIPLTEDLFENAYEVPDLD